MKPLITHFSKKKFLGLTAVIFLLSVNIKLFAENGKNYNKSFGIFQKNALPNIPLKLPIGEGKLPKAGLGFDYKFLFKEHLSKPLVVLFPSYKFSNPIPGFESNLKKTNILFSGIVKVYNPFLPGPIALDDISFDNLPGTTTSFSILDNDTLSTGIKALTTDVTIDLNPSTTVIDDSLIVPNQGLFVFDSISALVTFKPNAGFLVSPSVINYILTENGTGLKDTASISFIYHVLLEAKNDSSYDHLPGINAEVSILLNDTLTDGSRATFNTVTLDLDDVLAGPQSLLNIPGEGIWSYENTTGILTFNPETGFTSDPSIINYFLIENSTLLIDTAWVQVTYTEKPPISNNDQKLNNFSGAPIVHNILANDELSDGSPATRTLIDIDLTPNTPQLDDTLTIPGEGRWVYTDSTGAVTFTPATNFVSDPTPIEYVLIEKLTDLKDTASITFTIKPLKATNDLSSGNKASLTVTIDIIENDTLSHGSMALPAQVIVDIDTLTSIVDDTLKVLGQGEWTYSGVTGELKFIPDSANFSNPTPIGYKITEIATGLSRTAQVTVLVDPIVPPTAANDSSLNNLPGVTATINPFENDTLNTDLIASALTAVLDLDPNTPEIEDTLIIAGKGIFTFDSLSGVLSYKQQMGYFGNPGPIYYVLTDKITNLKDTAVVNVTFLLPIKALNDSSKNNIPGVNAIFPIVLNDTLSDGAPASHTEVTVDLNLTTPDNQAILDVAGQGVWSYSNVSGMLTFDPEDGFTIDPSPISYILRETSTSLFDTAIVSVTYTKIPPIANTDISLGIEPRTTVKIMLLDNDKLSDSSQATLDKVRIDLEPGVGGFEQTLFVAGEGNYSYDSTTAELTFIPSFGYYRSPTPIIYSITEKLTGLSDTAQIVINNDLRPSLELIMIGDLVGTGYINDSIIYSFTVINNGNVPITNISISEPKISPTPIPVIPSGLAPGGMGVAQFRYPLSAADIRARQVSNSAVANGLSITGIAVRDTSDNGDPFLVGNSNPTVVNFPYIPVIDVELKSQILGDCERAIGDTVTVRLIVSRKDSLIFLSDVVVQDSITSGFEFVSALASKGSYNSSLKEWTGIILAGSADSAILELKYKILTNEAGLTCITGWVKSQTFDDIDSNAGNKIETEDDISASCVSVPIHICPLKGESKILNAGSGYSSYQWYRDTVLITGATNSTYQATEGGRYTVLVNGSNCPGSSCCPIIVSELCDCKPAICVPLTLRKIN